MTCNQNRNPPLSSNPFLAQNTTKKLRSIGVAGLDTSNLEAMNFEAINLETINFEASNLEAINPEAIIFEAINLEVNLEVNHAGW